MKHSPNFIFDTLKDASRAVLSPALRDLHAEGTSDVRAREAIRHEQIGEVTRSIPLLLLFHICTALILTIRLSSRTGDYNSLLMFFLTLLPAGLLGGAWLYHDRTPHKNDTLVFRLIEAGGVFMGVIWTMPSALLMAQASGTERMVILGLVLTITSIGAISLARIPTAAILFTSFAISALSYSMVIYGGTDAVIGSALTITYGLVLTSIILAAHHDFLRRARSDFDVKNQQEVIALLLNDFERGTHDWLWETDPEGRLAYFSPRLGEHLGLAAEQIVGRTMMDLVQATPETPGWPELMADLAARQTIEGRIIDAHLRGQTAHWEITARPLFKEDGAFHGYRGVGRDVTQKWEAEQALREAKQAAETASSAKSQFLAVMSHELRTPINAIVGFSEMLGSAHGDNLSPETRQDYLNTIMESTRHLQSLINDLLDITRMEKGTLQLVEQDLDAAELVEVAARMCRSQAEGADVTVVARTVDNIGITGDVTRLKQVFLNLLTNAIKFTPAGGIVNVDMERTAQGQLVLAVRDAGIGISAADIERVFDPFYQAENSSSRRYGGMGLGLAIARKIARLHGGDVTLASEPGAGTTASLILPGSRIHWPQSKPGLRRNVA